MQSKLSEILASDGLILNFLGATGEAEISLGAAAPPPWNRP